MAISAQPVPSLRYRTLFQVLPPSGVLNTPRSVFEFQRWPRAQAYTVLLCFGCTIIRLTCSESGSPTASQLSPPSRERYTPVPTETLLRTHDSPVPTHTVFGFDGS